MQTLTHTHLAKYLELTRNRVLQNRGSEEIRRATQHTRAITTFLDEFVLDPRNYYFGIIEDSNSSRNNLQKKEEIAIFKNDPADPTTVTTPFISILVVEDTHIYISKGDVMVSNGIIESARWGGFFRMTRHDDTTYGNASLNTTNPIQYFIDRDFLDIHEKIQINPPVEFFEGLRTSTQGIAAKIQQLNAA